MAFLPSEHGAGRRQTDRSHHGQGISRGLRASGVFIFLGNRPNPKNPEPDANYPPIEEWEWITKIITASWE
jgi:hypothetical protein